MQVNSTNQHIATTKPARQSKKKAAPKGSPASTQTDHVSISSAPGKTSVKATVSPQKQAQAALDATVSANLPATLATPISEVFKSGFVEGYLTPKTIGERCLQLAQDFPDLVELIDTGINTHGYDGKNEEVKGPSDLFYLRLGPKTADRDKKVGVFQYAAPHARERINPMSMMELTEQLVHNYDPSSDDPKVKANTELLDQLDVYMAINTNPDGHNYAAYDNKNWRKNRAPVGEGHSGVDINRNYPYQWEKSDNYSSLTYSGSGPASEAETQAILKVVENHSNIKFVVDWHSYGQEIRRPKGTSKADDKVYDTMHSRVQEAIMGVGGRKYTPVISQVTKGSSDDHFYHENGIFSTVMETGKAFTPSEPEALKVMEESVEGAREFLRVAADYGKGQLQ